MLLFWTFYLSENPDVSLFPQKSYLVKTVFKINNKKKCFLSIKSIY